MVNKKICEKLYNKVSLIEILLQRLSATKSCLLSMYKANIQLHVIIEDFFTTKYNFCTKPNEPTK